MVDTITQTRAPSTRRAYAFMYHSKSVKKKVPAVCDLNCVLQILTLHAPKARNLEASEEINILAEDMQILDIPIFCEVFICYTDIHFENFVILYMQKMRFLVTLHCTDMRDVYRIGSLAPSNTVGTEMPFWAAPLIIYDQINVTGFTYGLTPAMSFLLKTHCTYCNAQCMRYKRWDGKYGMKKKTVIRVNIWCCTWLPPVLQTLEWLSALRKAHTGMKWDCVAEVQGSLSLIFEFGVKERKRQREREK